MPSAAADCPHCRQPMHAVRARARSGYCLLLDQCRRCGGIWCDRWELYPIAADEAARLDPLDAERLAAPAPPAAGAGACPRCTSPLRPFRDPLLPPDADIERCPVCDGLWLNRGALRRARARAAATPERALPHLTRALGDQRAWPHVANLDAVTYASDDTADDAPDWRGWLRTAAPWLALATLLRLVLR